MLATLRVCESALKQRGVAHAALFGSLARNEAAPASDIDIMIELDPEARIGLFSYSGLVQFIQDQFPGRVDVANRTQLRPEIRGPAERDAVYAF